MKFVLIKNDQWFIYEIVSHSNDLPNGKIPFLVEFFIVRARFPQKYALESACIDIKEK